MEIRDSLHLGTYKWVSQYPVFFYPLIKGKDLLLQTIKHIANKTQIKFSARAKTAARNAAVVWCVDETSLKILRTWNDYAELIQETGLIQIPVRLKASRHFDGIRGLNIVYSGSINTGKAVNILINALIKIKESNFHLTIIGDGPLLKDLKIRRNYSR